MCAISREERAWRQENRGRKKAGGEAKTLFQQEKNNLADVQRSRVNFTGFICTVAI
jgi:hypothetical protein